MTLDVWSLAYAPGVSVFPARSGFTPGWVYVHVGGGTHCCCRVLFLLCVAVFFTVLQLFTVRCLSHY